MIICFKWTSETTQSDPELFSIFFPPSADQSGTTVSQLDEETLQLSRLISSLFQTEPCVETTLMGRLSSSLRLNSLSQSCVVSVLKSLWSDGPEINQEVKVESWNYREDIFQST